MTRGLAATDGAPAIAGRYHGYRRSDRLRLLRLRRRAFFTRRTTAGSGFLIADRVVDVVDQACQHAREALLPEIE